MRGLACLFRGYEAEMTAGPVGDVAVVGGFVDPVDRPQPKHNIHPVSGSARTPAQGQYAQPAQTETPRLPPPMATIRFTTVTSASASRLRKDTPKLNTHVQHDVAGQLVNRVR
jgi:hypothetical protein